MNIDEMMIADIEARSAQIADYFTANRLQYMTNADKLNVSAQMIDRGLMTLNEVREIWQLPPVEGGDIRIIRGEYYAAGDKLAITEEEPTDDNN